MIVQLVMVQMGLDQLTMSELLIVKHAIRHLEIIGVYQLGLLPVLDVIKRVVLMDHLTHTTIHGIVKDVISQKVITMVFQI